MSTTNKRPVIDLGAWSTTAQPSPRPEKDDVLSDDDELISDPTDVTTTTRKIVRTELIFENKNDRLARLKAKVMHQRRGTKDAESEKWKDADSFQLSRLKAGEHVQIGLSGRETLRLFAALVERYRVNGDLSAIMDRLKQPIGGVDVSMLDEAGREIVKRWIVEEGEDFFTVVESLRPGLFDTVAIRRWHDQRERALKSFEQHMNEDDWQEADWQSFFKDNDWILGHGLSYQFLTQMQDQPHYGGVQLDGTGAKRGDFLMRTEAAARFTVLVEIKKPSARLLHSEPYRRDVFRPSKELAGGVAQVQQNCATWFKKGANEEELVALSVLENLHTYEPQGILLVGQLTEFEADRHRIGSFERFRRQVYRPEILTFDELLERSRFVLQINRERIESEE